MSKQSDVVEGARDFTSAPGKRKKRERWTMKGRLKENIERKWNRVAGKLKGWESEVEDFEGKQNLEDGELERAIEGLKKRNRATAE